MAKPPLRKKQVIVPCFYLHSTRSATHKYLVSRPLDGEANLNVVFALVSMGHTRGRSLYLQPPSQPLDPAAPPPTVPLKRRLSPENRIVIATRPALFEDPEANIRTRKRSFHELEAFFEDAWRPYFEVIRRNLLTLAPDIRRLLPEEFRNRGHIEVKQRQGSRYKRLADGTRQLPPEPRTCGFVLNKSDFYRGASLTSFFAMDGVSGLILSILLAERHPRWLEEPGLRIVEMIGTEIPPHVEDLGFLDDWEIVSVLHHAA